MGGFLVSAAREQGRTAWVAVRSEAGEPCVLKVPDWSGPLNVRADRQTAVKVIAPGEYQIDLRRGEQVLLYPQNTEVQPTIRPLPLPDSQKNLYGVKPGGQLKGNQTWPDRWIPAAEKPCSK